MKTIGIIAEYNPFHAGHEYQISYARGVLGADMVVVAMSGDFVQRGAPAVFEKALRTEMALRCGADLVLELPAPVCTASAEGFANGAVSLLDGLGVVDELCFGCESGDAGTFMRLAQILAEEPPSYRKRLHEALRQGVSFPAARIFALTGWLKENNICLKTEKTISDEIKNGGRQNEILEKTASENPEQFLQHFLSLPNNILALEYCRALLGQKSRMRPAILKREGNAYHETALSPGRLPSASALRRILHDMLREIRGAANSGQNAALSDPEEEGSMSLPLPEEAVPGAVRPQFLDAVQFGNAVFAEDFNSLFAYCLLRETPQSLSRYAGISGDLAQRIYRRRFEFRNFNQFGELLKTKEITRTRIDRGLFHMLLNIRNTPPAVPYARVLGFRKESAPLLTAIKKEGRIPLLTKPAAAKKLLTPEALAMLEETTFASNLYQTVLSGRTGRPFIHEYRRPLVIL